MDQGESGVRQHGLSKACNATDDIEADANRAAETDEFSDQLGDFGWCVEKLAVDANRAIVADGCDPVNLFGDVDPDTDPHVASGRLKVRRPVRAVVALHSAGSQSLISGRDGLAVPGALPREPSRAAR